MFTELRGTDAGKLNEALGRIGFRRSQNVAYRPSCPGCSACVSVRVLARQFKLNSTHRRLMRRNADLTINACKPWSTEEQYALLRRYLRARHPDGDMNTMDSFDFADMIEQSPVTSWVIEYREPSPDPERLGRLVGACLTDQQSDGLSMIYSFYDAAHETRSGLGTFIILDHIMRAAEANLPYVYLGYWISGCDRMNYKTRFKPVEQLTIGGWKLIVDEADI